MRKLSENEMLNTNGGGWFTQIFGRDWGPCMDMIDTDNGSGISVQHGRSWLWGNGVRPC